MNATPSSGSMMKAVVANASAAIVDGATTETLWLRIGDFPVFELTMW